MEVDRVCTKCHRALPLDDFYRLARGGRRADCWRCVSRQVGAWARERKREQELIRDAEASNGS